MTPQSFVKKVLPYIARLHYKNWKTKERWQYPQLWDKWPGFMTRHRGPRLCATKERVCGVITGHEISKTEWGYGGGKFVDRNCRWCDHVIRVPIAESPPPTGLLWKWSAEMDPINTPKMEEP